MSVRKKRLVALGPARVEGSLRAFPLDTVNNEGLIYWLGTDGGATAFVSPYGGDVLVTVSSSDHPATEGPQHLVDRTATGWVSSPSAGQWLKVQTVTGALQLSALRLRQRTNYSSELFRNLTVHGSNDNSTWTELAQKTDFAGGMGAWETWDGIGATEAFTYHRITQSGNNSSGSGWFCMAEVELFGTFMLSA